MSKLYEIKRWDGITVPTAYGNQPGIYIVGDDDIKRLYESQKHRVHQLYHQYKPLIKTKENVSRELSNKNIILSFNYGFKNYVAQKKKGGFVFNKTSCELKSALKFDNFNSIIFYLNVFVNGKLNLNIISPYILD